MGKEGDKSTDRAKEGDSSVKEAPKELANLEVQKEAAVTQKGSLREAAKAFLDKGTMGGFLEKGKSSAQFELYDSAKPAPTGDQKQDGSQEKGQEKQEAPESKPEAKYQQDVEKVTKLFAEAAEKTPPDLSDAIRKLTYAAERMPPEEFKEYIKEANKALHEAGLLPKGINLDDDKNRYGGHIQSGHPELPVETADGKVSGVLDTGGHDIGDTGAIPDLFDSRREKRIEARAEAADEIKYDGEKYFDAMDKDGDKRLSKDEIDQYIKDVRAGTAKMPDGSPVSDPEVTADRLQALSDNFDKIKRASNDDKFFEKGISKEDLAEYAEKRAERHEKRTEKEREKDVEKAVDLFKEGMEKKDLSKVIDEIQKKQGELGKEEYDAYIKELNKQLHEAGLLPKEVSIADSTKADRLTNLEGLFNKPVLPLVTEQGGLAAVDSKGEKVHGKDVPDLFDGGAEAKPESKPEAKPEAPSSKPADAPPKPVPADDFLDKKSAGIVDPFVEKHSQKDVWVQVGPKDDPQKTLDKFAEAALKRANGEDYKPTKEEIAKQAAEIIKDNPDAFPGGKVPKKFPPETDMRVEIPKPKVKSDPSLD